MVKDRNLMDKVVSSFGDQTDLSIHLEILDSEPNSVLFWWEGLDEPLGICIKKTLTQQNLPSVIYEMSQIKPKNKKVLFTSYLNPNVLEKLKEATIFCLDAVGNGFIQKSPFYFFIKGNKPMSEPFTNKKGRAFQYAGLKVIFALLQDSNLIHQSYREIAENADVSLGSIGDILKDLVYQNYIQVMGKNRTFKNKVGLLQRWVEAYPLLKQKYFLGRFTTDDSRWWKEIEIEHFRGLWGGEIAAEISTNYLQAQDGVVFISQTQKVALIKSAKLKKYKMNDDGFYIDLIEPFWRVETGSNILAPFLLVYADLVNSGDARNLETAKRIYEQYLN